MAMQFAVNYSLLAADLLCEGQIQLDLFKCPAWPDLIASVQEVYPVYVHFPLRVGAGINNAIDTETGQPADWRKVETLLAQTNTPFVNVHLAPSTGDYPDIPADTTEPEHIKVLTERMVQDVRAVVKQFGAERVIVENDHASRGRLLRPAHLPEIICRVIEESGCGFLFDLSHARLAAHDLNMGIREYINGLPIERVCEIHVTGIQRIEGHWINVARQVGIDTDTIQAFAGQLLDHLPMTSEDWEFAAWAMRQVHSGVWEHPWAVTFEVGGVSGLYEAVADRDVLATQIPRLYDLVKGELKDAAELDPVRPRHEVL
jgi:uncharacterized protein (UPF0276 family)